MSDREKYNQIALENGVFETRLTRKFARRKLYKRQDPRIIKAVIPGVVASIDTRVGEYVRKGTPLMILDAMKMLNRIMAPQDGAVKSIRVKKGEKVAKDQVLIEME